MNHRHEDARSGNVWEVVKLSFSFRIYAEVGDLVCMCFVWRDARTVPFSFSKAVFLAALVITSS